ncbi:MAG: STAS domain-containing protein [Planctomycetota bacterium]|jgi:anti-anti-sigma regulatory factor
MVTTADDNQKANRGWLRTLLLWRGQSASEASGRRAGSEGPPGPTTPAPAQRPKTRVVSVGGDLSDWRAVSELNRREEALLRRSGGRVVLDLQGVERADSKLVASLLALARRARSTRVGFEVRPSSQVRKWITFCRVDQHLARVVSTRTPEGPSGGAGARCCPRPLDDRRTRFAGPMVLA